MSNEQRFSNVWDALEDTVTASASLRARSNLMMAVQCWVKARKSTQVEAARVLGITQPRMSDLMRGKINLFSLESLLDMAALAGLQPQLTVKPLAEEDRDLERRFTGETSAGTSRGLVLEVRAAKDDGSKFVLGTETFVGAATSIQSHLTPVKLKRVA